MNTNQISFENHIFSNIIHEKPVSQKNDQQKDKHGEKSKQRKISVPDKPSDDDLSSSDKEKIKDSNILQIIETWMKE